MMKMNDYFFEYKDALLIITEIIEVNMIENIVFKKLNHHTDMKNSSTNLIMIKNALNDVVKVQKECLKK